MSDLKELKLDLEYLLGIPDGVFGDREVIYGELAETALEAITTLEAKLAVAREALEWADEYFDHIDPGCETHAKVQVALKESKP